MISRDIDTIYAMCYILYYFCYRHLQLAVKNYELEEEDVWSFMTSLTTDMRGRRGRKKGSGEEGLEGRESSSMVDMLPRSHGASSITTLTPVSSSTARNLRRPASAITRYLSKPSFFISAVCY